jgi:cytoskeletal protein CcmA (bactofilin family)
MTPPSQIDLENSSLAGKCTLSSGVKIKGSITFQKELVIDGTVQGRINSDGVLTIAENADIRGEIKSKSVTVYGKVHGNITAERCELKSKSTMEGDLRAASLIIEEGATFIGSSQNTLVSTVENPEIATDSKPIGSSHTSGDSLTPEGSLFRQSSPKTSF